MCPSLLSPTHWCHDLTTWYDRWPSPPWSFCGLELVSRSSSWWMNHKRANPSLNSKSWGSLSTHSTALFRLSLIQDKALIMPEVDVPSSCGVCILLRLKNATLTSRTYCHLSLRMLGFLLIEGSICFQGHDQVRNLGWIRVVELSLWTYPVPLLQRDHLVTFHSPIPDAYGCYLQKILVFIPHLVAKRWQFHSISMYIFMFIADWYLIRLELGHELADRGAACNCYPSCLYLVTPELVRQELYDDFSSYHSD